MFRMGLLTSTAMTAVTLLLSGAPTQAQTDMHVTSRDPNSRFLCTYGGFRVYDWWASWSGESRWEWGRAAVPITGHGETVSRIRVIEAPGSSGRADFSIGIYSNSPSGFPGNPIAVGTGKVGETCGPVKVSITPTKLKRNTRYWIEEQVHAKYSGVGVEVAWIAHPTTKRRGYSRFASSSSAGHWQSSSYGPYLKLR